MDIFKSFPSVTKHDIFSGKGRLQYDTYYHYGPVEDDATYNKNCQVANALKNIPEVCSKNAQAEKEWKEALHCGWWNSYDSHKIAKKALEDIEPYTQDIYEIACIAATVYLKTGLDHCLNFVLTWWVLYLSGVTGDVDVYEQRDIAEAAVKKYVSWWSGREYCPYYY